MRTKPSDRLPGLALLLSVLLGPLGSSRLITGTNLPPPVITEKRKNELLPLFMQEKRSGQEAVVRLILAETMAAQCPQVKAGNRPFIESLMAGIAKVIRNRIGKRESHRELKVVFAKNQFNSSLAQYACSEIDGFLNPEETYRDQIPGLTVSQLWSMAENAYDQAWTQPVFESLSSRSLGQTHKIDQKIKNYYLHLHDTKPVKTISAPPPLNGDSAKGDRNESDPRHGNQKKLCSLAIPSWVTSNKDVPLKSEEPLRSALQKCVGFYAL